MGGRVHGVSWKGGGFGVVSCSGWVGGRVGFVIKKGPSGFRSPQGFLLPEGLDQSVPLRVVCCSCNQYANRIFYDINI